MNNSVANTSHIEKLNGRNFPLWKFAVWLHLDRMQLVEIVEGRVLIPTEVKISKKGIELQISKRDFFTFA